MLDDMETDETLRAMALVEQVANGNSPNDLVALYPATWTEIMNSYQALLCLSGVMLRHWAEAIDCTPSEIIDQLRASAIEHAANE